jgi:hypothetical protein
MHVYYDVYVKYPSDSIKTIYLVITFILFRVYYFNLVAS